MINSDTKITATIDWLSVTSKSGGIRYPTSWSRKCTPLPKGRLNYNRGVEYIDGRIELWHDSRADMGTHVIMPGKCLRRLALLYGTNQCEIVSFFSFANIARIDLAVDVKHGWLDIGGMAESYQRDECTTKSESALHIAAKQGRGETLYLGGTKSKRRLRIYNKQAESGTNYEWTRVELQVRHKPATRTVMTLISRNVDAQSIAAAILDFADWESEKDWRLVMGCERLAMNAAMPEKSDRLNWILDTCARAIASEYMDGSTDVMPMLKKRVNEFISQKETKILDRSRIS